MQTITFLRQFRIAGYAIFDFVASFLGIYLLSPLLTKLCRKLGIEIPRSSWLYFTIPLSIPIHLVIGRMTPLTKNFMDLHDHYVLKIIIFALMVLGIKNIKKA